jgi:hypothetical protein
VTADSKSQTLLGWAGLCLTLPCADGTSVPSPRCRPALRVRDSAVRVGRSGLYRFATLLFELIDIVVRTVLYYYSINTIAIDRFLYIYDSCPTQSLLNGDV